jgi:hypothetical protein
VSRRPVIAQQQPASAVLFFHTVLAMKLLTKLPYPKDWIAELGDRMELINDPDARAAQLRELAYGCYSNHQVTYDQMADMLELIDAARWWAFNEQEEAWALDLFQDCKKVDDGEWGVRLE